MAKGVKKKNKPRTSVEVIEKPKLGKFGEPEGKKEFGQKVEAKYGLK